MSIKDNETGMVELMRRLTHFVTSAAAIGLLASSATIFAIDPGAAWAAPPNTTGATRVPLRQFHRACDFTQILNVQGTGYGATAAAMIRHAASSVTADVQMLNARPDTHYDVGLIQVPRPSSATCGPGDPGTAFGSLNTDGAGNGAVTLQDGIRSGTSGVFVVINRPNESSQNPAEFYSSDFIAPV